MSTNQDYSIIVQQLERMSSKIDDISKEVQLTNIEMAKLSGMKHAIQDLKDWRGSIDTAVNAEDLRKMKSTLSDVKKQTEEITQLEKDIYILKTEKEKVKEEIDKLKNFKTKIGTVFAVSFFILTTAITVIGWYLS
jgi:vacuolar-type H+-ATPase subunit I/STV1